MFYVHCSGIFLNSVAKFVMTVPAVIIYLEDKTTRRNLYALCSMGMELNSVVCLLSLLSFLNRSGTELVRSSLR